MSSPRRVIVDNSLWQLVGRDANITAVLLNLEDRDLIMSCPPQVLEYCRSARTKDEYALLSTRMRALYPAPAHPDVEDVIWVQERMRAHGIDIRQSSVADTLVAAYAIANGATVLAADHDFEHIRTATDGALDAEYIAPTT